MNDLNHYNGFQVRHDYLGWYVCSDDEAEFEDEGNPSAGFDGRDHWVHIELAQEALYKVADEAAQ